MPTPLELKSMEGAKEAAKSFQQIPAQQGRYRLYLCTETPKSKSFGVALEKQYLSAKRQESATSKIWCPVVHPEYGEFCSWSGEVPFKVQARQLEVWLRFTATCSSDRKVQGGNLRSDSPSAMSRFTSTRYPSHQAPFTGRKKTTTNCSRAGMLKVSSSKEQKNCSSSSLVPTSRQ